MDTVGMAGSHDIRPGLVNRAVDKKTCSIRRTTRVTCRSVFSDAGCRRTGMNILPPTGLPS